MKFRHVLSIIIFMTGLLCWRALHQRRTQAGAFKKLVKCYESNRSSAKEELFITRNLCINTGRRSGVEESTTPIHHLHDQ